MTEPKEAHWWQLVMIARRTAQRQFFWRPGRDTRDHHELPPVCFFRFRHLPLRSQDKTGCPCPAVIGLARKNLRTFSLAPRSASNGAEINFLEASLAEQ